MTMQPELRIGPRTVIRKGDLCQVRAGSGPRAEFKSGWSFLGYNAEQGFAEVKDPRTSNVRSVSLDRIKAMPKKRGS